MNHSLVNFFGWAPQETESWRLGLTTIPAQQWVVGKVDIDILVSAISRRVEYVEARK